MHAYSLTWHQVSQTLEQTAQRFTPPRAHPDSVIDRVLVIASDRKKVEQEDIPEFFTPVTGKWGMKGKHLITRGTPEFFWEQDTDIVHSSDQGLRG